MSANAITALQQAVRDYFTTLAPAGTGPTALVFEQLGRPIELADYQPDRAGPPQSAEEAARLTNHMMRTAAGVAVRSLLSVTAVEEFVLNGVARPGLTAAQLALFEQIKSQSQRRYANSRQVSVQSADEYLPVATEPHRWYAPDTSGWSGFSYDSGTEPEQASPTGPVAEPAWQFQLAGTSLRPVLDQPPTVTRELWQPVVEPDPLLDPGVFEQSSGGRFGTDQPQNGPGFARTVVPTQGPRTRLAGTQRLVELANLADLADRVHAAPSRPQTAPVESGRIAIDFEYQLVTIDRGWWCAPLLELDCWYVPELRQGQLSDGKPNGNTGSAPALPVAFLLIRNLKVSGQWTSADQQTLQASLGLGPFSLIGRSVTSTSDAVTLTIPGCQIVAWMCETLPMLPPTGNP